MSDHHTSDGFNKAGFLNKTLAEQRRTESVNKFHDRASSRMDQVYERHYAKWLSREIERVWKERNKPDFKPRGPELDKSKTAGSIEAEAGRRVQHRQQRRKDRLLDWRDRELNQPRQSRQPERPRSEWRERTAAKAQEIRQAQAEKKEHQPRNLSMRERAERTKQEWQQASKDKQFER